MFDFFYKTKVNILVKSSEMKDERGKMRFTYSYLESFLCDMQPSSKEYLNNKLGKHRKDSYILYCKPNENINMNCILEINEIQYQIENIKCWDNHYEIFIVNYEYN